MNTKLEGPQLVRLAEAAKILRISRSTFYRLQKSDPSFPKVVKLGRRSQFRLVDLEEYVDQAIEA